MKSVYRLQALLLVALLSVSGLYALNITTTISQTLDYGYEPNQLSASAEISFPEIGFVAGLQVSPATFDSTFHY